jgi:hypothetical protein
MKLSSSLRFALGAVVAMAITPLTIHAREFDRRVCTKDLSELVHEGQKVCPWRLLCREGLLHFQGFARPQKPRTKGSPQAEE